MSKTLKLQKLENRITKKRDELSELIGAHTALRKTDCTHDNIEHVDYYRDGG